MHWYLVTTSQWLKSTGMRFIVTKMLSANASDVSAFITGYRIWVVDSSMKYSCVIGTLQGVDDLTPTHHFIMLSRDLQHTTMEKCILFKQKKLYRTIQRYCIFYLRFSLPQTS